MNKNQLLAALLSLAATASAHELSITSFRHVGPLPLQRPVILDSTDVKGEAFKEDALLATPLRLESVRQGQPFSGAVLPKTSGNRPALHLLAFDMTNTAYTKATINVRGLDHHELYIDGTKVPSGTERELLPATHEVIIKALTTATSKDSLSVTVVSPTEGCIMLNADGSHRLYTMREVLHARRYNSVKLSPNGRWMTVTTTQTQPDGKAQTVSEVREVATGRVVCQREGLQWMPRKNLLYFTRQQGGQRQLVTLDPLTMKETVIADGLPEGRFDVAPTEDRIVFTLTDEGPRERADVYEVIHPDDRQPGWRTRTHLAIYDLATGLMQPLTFGHVRTYLTDISLDGRHALVMTSHSRMGHRPTELVSLYRIDLQTLETDTLVRDEGFIGSATFSPDARQVLITGSPEAFGGIGKNVREGQTPSMIDTQLFILDLASRNVRAMTRQFDPNVQSVGWNAVDNHIYFSAEDGDSINLFRMSPDDGTTVQLRVPEELIARFDYAAAAPVMVFFGQSASNSDRLYSVDLRKIKAPKRPAAKGDGDTRKAYCPTVDAQAVLLEDLSAVTLKGVELGACEPYVYTNERGEHISCRYYLPPHFDASKRYPMIVNYYGGCSPQL